jgi:pilus assembly protein Flp/PilA
MPAKVRIFGHFRRFLGCEEGATAIEYALIAGGIAVAISTVVFSLGETVEAAFQSVVDGFADGG